MLTQARAAEIICMIQNPEDKRNVFSELVKDLELSDYEIIEFAADCFPIVKRVNADV